MGDELEISMLNYVGAKVDEEGTCNYLGQDIKVLKLFEFDSLYARMSVIVKIYHDYYLFSKGAPEILS